MTPHELDRLILSSASIQWLKVATIVSRVYFQRERDGTKIDVDAIADRIRKLVEDGKLQRQGNLSRMRHSEVRLPD